MRLTEITQTKLRNALGIPHSFPVFHFPSTPFISLYFKVFQGVSALRVASALATVNGEKERKREELSHTLLHSHIARALCPNSEIMRKKEKARKKKVRAEMGELEEKRKSWRIRGIAL